MLKSFLAKRFVWLGTERPGRGVGGGACRLDVTAFRLVYMFSKP